MMKSLRKIDVSMLSIAKELESTLKRPDANVRKKGLEQNMDMMYELEQKLKASVQAEKLVENLLRKLRYTLGAILREQRLIEENKLHLEQIFAKLDGKNLRENLPEFQAAVSEIITILTKGVEEEKLAQEKEKAMAHLAKKVKG